jgi:hypothetical protein
MFGLNNDVALSIGLAAIAIYFTVQTTIALSLVIRCWAMRRRVLAVWPARGPRLRGVWLALGLVASVLAVGGAILDARWLHTLSQGVMAVYFLAVPPLARTMSVGFYATGIWLETGFLPYDRITRWTFHETPDVLLILVVRGTGRAVVLPVPSEEYGLARKILHTQVRDRVLQPDPAILNLDA